MAPFPRVSAPPRWFSLRYNTTTDLSPGRTQSGNLQARNQQLNHYDSLRNYLSRPYFAGHRFMLDFEEIESILGRPLPQAARTNQRWWSNHKGSWQSSAWRHAGCRVIRIDLVRGRITFHKPADYRLRCWDGSAGWDRFRIRSLRRHMRLTQAAFAQLIGVVQQNVSNLETGRFLPTDDLNRRLTSLARRTKFFKVSQAQR